MADDIIVKIIDETVINVNIAEETSIVINIDDVVPALSSNIFVPDEDGLRIVKMYIKDGKLKVKYEGGE